MSTRCECGDPWCSGEHLTDAQADALREVFAGE
jgi:hypothetical protein